MRMVLKVYCMPSKVYCCTHSTLIDNDRRCNHDMHGENTSLKEGGHLMPFGNECCKRGFYSRLISMVQRGLDKNDDI